MKAAIFALLACVCASVQAQQVRLEYADTFGTGIAFVGVDQIAIDVVLEFPPGSPAVAGGGLIILADSLATTSGLDLPLPSCPAPVPCVDQITDLGDGYQIVFQASGGFNGLLTLATLRFNADAVGIVEFSTVDDPQLFQPGGVPYPPTIDFPVTTVEIIAGVTGASGSLPEEFENPVGVPANWSTFYNPPLPRGPEPVWRSSAEPGACVFGNVTDGNGNASCLENDQPTKGAGVMEGSFLCTDSPLDTSQAMLPFLGLQANFQPNPGGATFRVISGNTPPPNIATYTTRFVTTDAIGQFESLPGQSVTVPLPSESPLYICIVVEGDFAYTEVDECVSCALSYGSVPDQDGDGIDDNVDNCLDQFNPDQRDTDNDSIGNACDADIAPAAANDCAVNFLDLGAVKAAFFSSPGQANYNPDADFNGDNIVNFADLILTKQQFFGAPGPSGLLNNCNVAERSRRADCAIPD